MQITFAKLISDFYGNFSCYWIVKNGINMCIPNDVNNSDYKLMMQEVNDGLLTIE